jgi:YVTN family beta-propeller protein
VTLLGLAGAARWLARLPDTPESTGPTSHRRLSWPLAATAAVAALLAAGVVVLRVPGVDTVFLRDLAISPDGRRLYALGGSDLLSMIDLVSGDPVGEPVAVGPGSCCIAVSPDGGRVYVSNSGDVSMIDTATGRPVGPPVPVGPLPHRLVVGRDGALVYVGGSTGVSIIDTAARSSRLVPVDGGVGGIAAGGDGSRLWFTVPDGVRSMDTATGTVGDLVPIAGIAGPLALTVDDRLLYVVLTRGSADFLDVVDTAAATVRGSPVALPNGPAFDLAAGPDGNAVYVTSLFSETVTAVPTGPRAPLPAAFHVPGPTAVVASPDGRHLYTGGGGYGISVVDLYVDAVEHDPIPVPALHP